jgi:alanine racemase
VPPSEPVPPAECRVDLAAVRSNVEVLRELAAPAAVLAVVKADGYGHGMLPVARACLEAGAGWLGVALPSEALQLRAAGIAAPVLAWLVSPGDRLDDAVAADVQLGAYAAWTIDAAMAAAGRVGRPARLHLKVDTGLGRGGAAADRWPDLVDRAAKAAADGSVEVTGIWSHFAYADAPGHPTVNRQLDAFRNALEVAARAGLQPPFRHLANSAATLTRPEAHYELVRPGLAVYGLTPGLEVGPPGRFGLRPAMTLVARVAHVKRLPAGHGVSYGHRYRLERDATVALVPLGYADGVPRAATNTAEVWLAGARRRIAGTVCMDQFLVDVEDASVRPGDEVVLFGPGQHGEPTADDWAAALDTINYEVVTRIGPRVARRYLGASR